MNANSPKQLRYERLGNVPAQVDVRVEVTRWSFAKRRPDGSVDFVSPVPTVYDYGSIEGTIAADGDPLDAVLMRGDYERGRLYTVPVRAVLGFIDAGNLDAKVICSYAELRARDIRRIELFFGVYAWFKRALYLKRGVRGRTERGQWLRKLDA